MSFPKIMGILNVTPDSFSDGGRYFNPESAIKHAFELIEDGAELIDIGGESTRPGSLPVDSDEEIRRIIPVIKKIIKEKPDTIISVDTNKPSVALSAINEGAKLINCVNGIKNDENLLNIAFDKNVGMIIMHIQGEPRTMQLNPRYNNVIEDVYKELNDSINLAKNKGIKKIIADVGIGFGKALEHNLELLKNLEKFKDLNVPLLLGISRKSFIGKLLEIENTDERDVPTTLIHALLLTKPIDYIRVHNVKQINMLKRLYNNIF